MSKTPTKEGLRTELSALLSSAHGELKEKGKQVAEALDKLVKEDTLINRELLSTAIRETMTSPSTKDPTDLKKVYVFMEHVATYLQTDLQKYHEFNELVKNEQKRLRERIEKVQEQHRRLGM
jgi:hypothetical protein